MSEEFEQALADIWQVCVDTLFSIDKYVDGLDSLLREKGVTSGSRILDVAGGVGFPMIDLTQRGYSVVYNDGSPAMYAAALENARRAGISLAGFNHGTGLGMEKWQEFGRHPPNSWDVLICRGNSLPYAASWGEEEPDLHAAHLTIKDTLSEFNRMLAPGGILYVDKHIEGQLTTHEDLGTKEIYGEKVRIMWDTINDIRTRTRYWIVRTLNQETGEGKAYVSRAYLLCEDELEGLLHQTGFGQVEKHILPGDIYEAFVATKV